MFSKNLKVLKESDETKIGFNQAILRDIPYIILGFILWIYTSYRVLIGEDTSISTGVAYFLFYAAMGWFILEFITMLTNDKRRAVHDYIAGTVVVRT